MLLEVLFRWMHILAAITAVGGTIFMRVALLPSQSVLSEESSEALREALRSHWAKVVHGCVLFLLVSGIFNIATIVNKYDVKGPYHPLFGVKFLLALAIFGIASVLVGRSPLAVRMRRNARFWLSVNMALAITLVCISVVLKVLPHVPKVETSEPAVSYVGELP